MADRKQFDDPWKPEDIPRPSGMRGSEDLELPEPDITPPDIGGLDQAIPPQQALPQPDMLLPLPGHEGAPFPTGDEGSQSQQEGGGIQELVSIVREGTDKLDEVVSVLGEIRDKLNELKSTYGE